MENYELFIDHLKNHFDSKIINDLINSLDKKPTGSLLLNTKKINIETLNKYFSSLRKHPFIDNVYYYDKQIDSPGKSFLFDNGAYYIMDSSSLLIHYFLDIKDGFNILDLCAAPGGKTISISLKNPNCNIISNDISMSRILSMRENLERLGIVNVSLSCINPAKLNLKYKNTFDIIILDAPCSGSSMFRKNEFSKLDWSIEKVNKCVSTQKELIQIAFNLLKPGGILSYSTCSFSYEENEGVILDFLSKESTAKLINLPHIEGEYRHKDLKEAMHLFPNLYNGEGQFICQIKKDESLINSTLPKNKKLSINKQKDLKLINFYYQEIKNNHLYLFNNYLDLSNFNIIKNGLDAYEIKNELLIPTFHLAHYLDNNNSIKLNEIDFKKYLHGDLIKTNLDLPNGFYVVSYENINLGYVKKVGNDLKNYYPKGLRH